MMGEEKRERERGTKRESLVVKSGVRRLVGAVAGARFFQIKSICPCLLLVSSGFRLSELWTASNRRGSVPGVTTRLREGWRGCGKDGAVKTLVVRVLYPGDGGSHRSVAAGLLAPSQESFFSSAVIGSSLRGVKAYTALPRRLSTPSLLGFSLSRLFLFLRFSLGSVACVLVGGEWTSPAERVMMHAMLSSGCLWWTVVDEISPRRSILSDIRAPKMFAVKSDRAMELRFGRAIRSLDLRRWREAVVTWWPRDTCPLDVEDGNTCPRNEKSDLRGGRNQVRDESRVFSSWAVGNWSNWVTSFSSVGFWALTCNLYWVWSASFNIKKTSRRKKKKTTKSW